MECGDGGRVVGEWWCWSVVMLVIVLERVVLVLGVWRVVIVGGWGLLESGGGGGGVMDWVSCGVGEWGC